MNARSRDAPCPADTLAAYGLLQQQTTSSAAISAHALRCCQPVDVRSGIRTTTARRPGSAASTAYSSSRPRPAGGATFAADSVCSISGNTAVKSSPAVRFTASSSASAVWRASRWTSADAAAGAARCHRTSSSSVSGSAFGSSLVYGAPLAPCTDDSLYRVQTRSVSPVASEITIPGRTPVRLLRGIAAGSCVRGATWDGGPRPGYCGHHSGPCPRLGRWSGHGSSASSRAMQPRQT